MQSKRDYSLFCRQEDERMCIVLVYVDHLLISGDDAGYICTLKQDLHNSVKDLGEMRYFLGLEVARNEEGIMSNKRKYALDIVADIGLNNCKEAKFPFPKGIKLYK